MTFCLLGSIAYGQVDSTSSYPPFDSQLLRLKVPEAFQRSSLKLEIFADSSWQLYRGSVSLGFSEALNLLGQSEKIAQSEAHLKKEAELFKDYRSRRVFSMIAGTGGATYLAVVWSKGWLYQIPGYVAIIVAGQRLWESRKIEMLALREQYYIQTLVSPSQIQLLVDDYNFELYQYLSNAGIQFSDS
ncbi:MAG: hypothetical protein U9Q77_09515 [Candidatus Marinimicrobia bacterium]|nr:hypothetical protein [Candidatus Neomarinimicrobiota bacterium]